MGDAAEILGLQKKVEAKPDLGALGAGGGGAGGASLHGAAKAKMKKPLGMSREAYALMSAQGLPSIMPTKGGAGVAMGSGGGGGGAKGGAAAAASAGGSGGGGGFAKKRASGPARWEWRAFTNSARKDPAWGVLKLHHWQPKDADRSQVLTC